MNREPLWPSGYSNSSTYQLVTTLNKVEFGLKFTHHYILNSLQFRNFLVKSHPDWVTSPSDVISTSPVGISILKGNVISVMTTIGSPVGPSWNVNGRSLTPDPASERQHGSLYPVPQQHATHRVSRYDFIYCLTLMHRRSILSCHQLVVGSNQTITVEYTLGGRPSVLIPSELLNGSGLCGYSANVSNNTRGNSVDNGGAPPMRHEYSSVFITLFTLFFGVVTLSL